MWSTREEIWSPSLTELLRASWLSFLLYWTPRLIFDLLQTTSSLCSINLHSLAQCSSLFTHIYTFFPPPFLLYPSPTYFLIHVNLHLTLLLSNLRPLPISFPIFSKIWPHLFTLGTSQRPSDQCIYEWKEKSIGQVLHVCQCMEKNWTTLWHN